MPCAAKSIARKVKGEKLVLTISRLYCILHIENQFTIGVIVHDSKSDY